MVNDYIQWLVDNGYDNKQIAAAMNQEFYPRTPGDNLTDYPDILDNFADWNRLDNPTPPPYKGPLGPNGEFSGVQPTWGELQPFIPKDKERVLEEVARTKEDLEVKDALNVLDALDLYPDFEFYVKRLPTAKLGSAGAYHGFSDHEPGQYAVGIITQNTGDSDWITIPHEITHVAWDRLNYQRKQKFFEMAKDLLTKFPNAQLINLYNKDPGHLATALMTLYLHYKYMPDEKANIAYVGKLSSPTNQIPIDWNRLHESLWELMHPKEANKR